MEDKKYFVVRRKNKVLFIKTNKNSMWETTLAESNYSEKPGKSLIFRDVVNEVLGSNYNFQDLFALSPNEKKELFKP